MYSIVPKQPVRHVDFWGDISVAATLSHRMPKNLAMPKTTAPQAAEDEFATSALPNTFPYRWELIRYFITESFWDILGFSICRHSCAEYPLDTCYVYHVPFFVSGDYCITDDWGKKRSSISRYDYLTKRGNAVEVGAGLNMYVMFANISGYV